MSTRNISLYSRFLLWLFPMVISSSLVGQISLKPFNKTRALVVGISRYQNEAISLQYADRDAEAFAHFLREETAWNVPAEDLVLLTNEQATYGKFLNELQALFDSSGDRDRLIIYFAGHGDVEKVEEEMMGYLLFHDVAPTTYASAGACLVTTLNDYLEKLVLEKGTEVILITDACRSGSLAGSNLGGPTATTGAIAGLFQDCIKFLSCEPEEQSQESKEWGGGRGLFSYYFVNGLRGMADEDQNLYLDLYEIERYVEDNVRAASNRRQTPQRIGGSSSKRLFRIDREVLEQLQQSREPVATQSSPEPLLAAGPDTSYLPQLARFEAALARKQLLYPEEGSANKIYESLGDAPAAQPIKKIMKISLATALQDEAQQALNEYIVSPGRELAKRWSDAAVYVYYPDYLDRAADLLGQSSYFFQDVKSRAHYFRGVNLRLQYDALGEDGDPELLERALQEQQTALQLQRIAPHIYNEMGLLYRRLQQYPQAITAFQTALNLSPRWSLALTNLALVYQTLEQYPQAEKFYKDAIQLDTTFALSYYNLAKLYQAMERPDLAEREYRKVMTHDPGFSDAYYNLGRIFAIESGRYEEAEPLLLQYIQLKPEDADGYDLLGYLYMYWGKWEKAQRAFQSALTIEPGSFRFRSTLGYVYEQMGDYSAAEELWKQRIQEVPDDPEGYLKLLGVYSLTESYEAALATLRTLLEGGFADYDRLQEAQDLEDLRSMPAYQQLMKQFFPDRG